MDPELAKAEKCLEIAKILNPGTHYNIVQATAAFWMDLSLEIVEKTLKELKK